MRDFWRDCGYHLLERRENGHLTVTDDFLRAYLNRPEVGPVPASNEAERALHADLLRNPREAASKESLAAIAEPDDIATSRVVRGFRDRLQDAATLEETYNGPVVRPDGVRVHAPLG